MRRCCSTPWSKTGRLQLHTDAGSAACALQATIRSYFRRRKSTNISTMMLQQRSSCLGAQRRTVMQQQQLLRQASTTRLVVLRAAAVEAGGRTTKKQLNFPFTRIQVCVNDHCCLRSTRGGIGLLQPAQQPLCCGTRSLLSSDADAALSIPSGDCQAGQAPCVCQDSSSSSSNVCGYCLRRCHCLLPP